MPDQREPEQTHGRWLLLIHQIPPRPHYLRIKVSRRLARVGAVAIKNSVYVLPRSDAAFEDFEWIRAEILQGGGDVTVCEARLLPQQRGQPGARIGDQSCAQQSSELRFLG